MKNSMKFIKRKLEELLEKKNQNKINDNQLRNRLNYLIGYCQGMIKFIEIQELDDEMMKKPTKRKAMYDTFDELEDSKAYAFDDGWNRCCEEWEKFLPSEEEILEIVEAHKYKTKSLAKSIYERLQG